MKSIKIFLASILLASLSVASDEFACKQDGKIVPEWICNPSTLSDEEYTTVGISDSYEQAIAFGICDINLMAGAKVTANKTKETATKTKHFSKHYYSNEILSRSILERKGDAYSSKCQIIFEVNTNQPSKIEIFQIAKGTGDNEVQTITSTVNKSHFFNLEASLRKAGIKVLKTYTDKKHNFYIAIHADDSKIKE